ncbi:MAG: hypothetical protein ACJAR2_000842 [Ilumatobacter sp.]|jgi:hypothetical protein
MIALPSKKAEVYPFLCEQARDSESNDGRAAWRYQSDACSMTSKGADLDDDVMEKSMEAMGASGVASGLPSVSEQPIEAACRSAGRVHLSPEVDPNDVM